MSRESPWRAVLAAERGAALAAGGVLLTVYLATLAPDVTLWDAGEFASAVESLGIPHPPGTPLYVLLARAWRLVLPVSHTVLATNLLAAVCTAAAGAIGAWLVARWTRDTLAGVAAGVTFGVMSSVWLNATETEVYSASLLLSMLMLLVADRAWTASRDPFPARDARGVRLDRLLVYLFAIAPPLHLSAMVAAPGAIALASADERLRLDGARASLLLGAAVLAIGVGTADPRIAVGGAVILALRSLGRALARRGWLGDARRVSVRTAAHPLEGVVMVAIVATAATVFLFFLLRARLDPALNQGNPSSLTGVIDVMARRQYDVPGLWPRRAPLWLQVGNVIQYLDWQFALGLDRAVGASWRRTLFTPVFLALAIVGSVVHRRRDPRSWTGMLVLLGAATLGVVAYLNLRAGPSYGYGILPDDAGREARERDYFFALGFAALGLWIGQGAVAGARVLASRLKSPRIAVAGLALAGLPIVLNWRAMDRRREPIASLPTAFARATLESAPPNAVLFVAGDNDTYPLWYAQVGRGVRRDVTLVTVPLLGASWYRAELARRFGLYPARDTAGWRGAAREMAVIAQRALEAGRPVAAAVALDRTQREALAARWSFRGLIYVATGSDEMTGDPGITTESGSPAISERGVDSTAAAVGRAFARVPDAAGLDDPSARYVASLLACPGLALAAVKGGQADRERLLASRCNFR